MYKPKYIFYSLLLLFFLLPLFNKDMKEKYLRFIFGVTIYNDNYDEGMEVLNNKIYYNIFLPITLSLWQFYSFSFLHVFKKRK